MHEAQVSGTLPSRLKLRDKQSTAYQEGVDCSYEKILCCAKCWPILYHSAAILLPLHEILGTYCYILLHLVENEYMRVSHAEAAMYITLLMPKTLSTTMQQ